MSSRLRYHLLLLGVLLIILLTLTACGGGGASSEGGIGGSGISRGVTQNQDQTSGKQKVTVNGVAFDTNNAKFNSEGQPATQQAIQLGMVVTVTGTINPDGVTGTAATVSYDDILEGPIQQINTSTLIVMGQTVIFDGLTKFNGFTSVTELQPGDVIEVSGFFTANQDVYATYIEEKTPAQEHEITGLVSKLDPATSDFNIGMLRVINNSGNSGWQDGDLVRAEGSYNATSGEFNATSVELFNRNLELEDADEAELEGLVTSPCLDASNNIALPCSFTLGFVTVHVVSNTDLDGGLLVDIQPGTHIEVEGRLQNNVILAEEIEFEDNIELISNVTAVDTLNKSITLEFGINDVTVFYDEAITELEGFPAFSNIDPTAHIEVRARQVGANQYLATRIENKAGDTKLLIQGTLENKSQPEITLLGVTIDTTGLELEDSDSEQMLSPSEFFNLIETNKSVIKLEGTIDQQTLTWTKAEIE